MKTIQYFLDNVKKTPENECWINEDKLGNECDVWCGGDINRDKLESNVKCYYLHKWSCSGDHVGLRAYYLNDKLVAISYQQGRKEDEEFQWVSISKKNQVRKFLFSVTCLNHEYSKKIDFKFDWAPHLYGNF